MMPKTQYPANKHYSSAELKRIAVEYGWIVEESKVKGSHSLVSKSGHDSFIIPCKISPGVEHAIKKALGLK